MLQKLARWESAQVTIYEQLRPVVRDSALGVGGSSLGSGQAGLILWDSQALLGPLLLLCCCC